MLASKFRSQGALAVILLAGFSAGASADEVVSYAVRAVTNKGTEFTGRVPRTEAFDELLKDQEFIDAAKVDPDERLKVAGVNGLNGSITFVFGDLRSVQIEGRLTEEDLEQRRESEAILRQRRLADEQERLRWIQLRREAARKAKQQEQEQAQREQAGTLVLPEKYQVWIDRFPPDQGWIPARKARLYYQTVILDNRPPTDEERAWLDAYDQWKPAYDAWLTLEKLKLEMQDDAENVPEPSGTVVSPGASIDPAEPTPEQRKKLPPPLEPGVPEPTKVSPEAPEPVPLKPYATEPKPLKDGTRP